MSRRYEYGCLETTFKRVYVFTMEGADEREFKDVQLVVAMNILDAEGWELVTSVPETSCSTERHMFRRARGGALSEEAKKGLLEIYREVFHKLPPIAEVMKKMTIRCDSSGCVMAPSYLCTCVRCAREGSEHEERFHACEGHQAEASIRHRRMRGCAAEWSVWEGQTDVK